MQFGKKNQGCSEKLVSDHKNSGVRIDNKLNCIPHTNCSKKLNQFCGVAYQARHFFSRKQLVRFYDAYIKSRISYGLSIYGNTSENHLSEIFKAEKRINRSIYFKRSWESAHEIMNKSPHATVFEPYFIELLKVFLQIRNQTPVQTLNFSELHKRPHELSV